MIKFFTLKNLEILPRDFEFEFNKGVYLFEGPNGSGKTTVLDSLHPHDNFVSRNISVRDILKVGGIKEVVITRGDDEYLFRIKKRKGSDEFFVSKNGKKVLNTTSVKTYKQFVESLFPSSLMSFLQLHSRAGRLSDMTNSELKKIFLRLADTDVFEQLREIVKTKITNETTSFANLEGQMNGLLFNYTDYEEKELQKKIKERNSFDNRITLLKNELKLMEETKERYITLTTKVQSLENNITNLKLEKEQFDDLLQQITAYEDEIKKLPELEQEEKELRTKYETMQTEHFKFISKLEQKVTTIKTELSNLERSINDAKSLESLPCDDSLKIKCPLVSTRTTMPLNELEEMKTLFENKLKDLENKKQILNDDFNNNTKTIKLRLTELETIIKKLRLTDSKLATVKGKITRIKDIKKNLNMLSNELILLNKELQTINYSPVVYNEKTAELTTLEQQKTELEKEIMKMEEALTKKETLKKLENELKTAELKIANLNILKKTFSVNELPALELITILEQVNHYTNLLFDRFKPEFKAKLGLKNDSYQSLNLEVLRDGTPVPFSMLSDGEAVWIDKFLRFAFAFLTKLKHSYFDYLYCDEGEGALYHGVREQFLEMHKSLVNDYGFKQLFMVSHDIRATKLFDNVIHF